ncbi:MAG: hypothetical protein GXY80_01550 [Syntrophorhabdus aromaticivorans]|uniref:Uncharacterized protein n=1 Tax=Syntrophorhabdus aromaticivorans TaxID=328301 RepID=A0A971M200_9BACT|nr:hypothetical protein [Syntrophorhabdus aromaticivorans]
MDIHTLAELFLASLYDMAERQPHSYFFFPVQEIAARIGTENLEQLVQAALTMESRGLVSLAGDPFGPLSAMISPEGIWFVENGGETGIIRAYRSNPSAVAASVNKDMPVDMESLPPLPEGVTPEKSPEVPEMTGIELLVTYIASAIADDDSLDAVTREDALRDVETVKIQLGRATKNLSLISALLDSLSNITSIRQMVADLGAAVLDKP